MELIELVPLLQNEMAYGHAVHGNFHNSQEQWAVLQEEVDEWRDAIKANTDDYSMYELIQVAAVALRYVVERGDAEQIRKQQVSRHLSTRSNHV